MLWYKIIAHADLFGSEEYKERFDEVNNYDIEELENLDDNEKREIEEMNTGIYSTFYFYIAYEEDRFKEDYETFKRILNYAFRDYHYKCDFPYEIVKDEKELEILNSDFIDKYYTLTGFRNEGNKVSNGFIRDTYAKKCLMVTSYFEFLKFDIEEVIQIQKLAAEAWGKWDEQA